MSPYCAPVTNGAVPNTFAVANPANTNPVNISYRVTVYSKAGVPLLTYLNVQFSGASFNFDQYAPGTGLTFNTVAANQVYAGPASGSPAVAGFRSLVAADEPATTVNSIVNDTNVTGLIASQALTLGFTGTLAANRLNSSVVQSVINDTNIAGSIANQALTLGWLGTLSAARIGVLPESQTTNLVSDLASKLSTPSGTGFAHITAGVADGTSKVVDLSSVDVTGTLSATRLGTFTGDVQSAGGSYALTLPSIVTPGTGLKTTVNAKGQVTAVATAACGDLSNAAASCSVDATNASNLSTGTLPAARLPNPSASTLGGIQSAAAQSNKWISSISTSGAPNLSQIDFSNLSGTATAAQIPTAPNIQGRFNSSGTGAFVGTLYTNHTINTFLLSVHAYLISCTGCSFTVNLTCSDPGVSSVGPSVTVTSDLAPTMSASDVFLCGAGNNDIVYRVTKNSGSGTWVAYWTATQI